MPSTTGRCPLPPAWIFDRADRLAALAARCRELADGIHRERCDSPDPADRGPFDRRSAILDGRFRKLSERARIIRRNDRLAAAGGRDARPA